MYTPEISLSLSLSLSHPGYLYLRLGLDQYHLFDAARVHKQVANVAIVKIKDTQNGLL